jgi:hypothetical protein
MEHCPRPSKRTTRTFVVELAPLYTEMLRDIQLHKWSGFPSALITIRNNLKIHNYVELYDDKRRILAAVALGLLGLDGLKDLNAELKNLTHQEQCTFLDQLTTDVIHIDLENLLPKTDEEWATAARQFQLLSGPEKEQATKQAQWFWSGIFAYFHDVLSLMVHGTKLTALVEQAINGCTDAFGKAIQIDRSLLAHHPFFRQRRLEAHEKNDIKFLIKIAYREINPLLRGKIRYPGLYMVFACLDAANHLDDFTHAEILDICDEARLDRYQNSIGDVNYVTKRFREYRRKQKCGELSMH